MVKMKVSRIDDPVVIGILEKIFPEYKDRNRTGRCWAHMQSQPYRRCKRPKGHDGPCVRHVSPYNKYLLIQEDTEEKHDA